MEQGTELNWAMAEALAIGSLLYQGTISTIDKNNALSVDVCHYEYNLVSFRLNHILEENDSTT